MKRSFSTLLFVAILALGSIVGTAGAQEYEVQVKDLGGGVAWYTNFQYGEADLTLVGPRKYQFIRSFGAAEIGWDAGQAIDGQYRWEIQFRNELSKGLIAELEAARAKGNAEFACELVETGVIQAPSFSGSFVIVDGAIIIPDETQEEPRGKRPARTTDTAIALGDARVPTKDQVILDDLIVDGSACIGFDCVNGESFGFDTIRLKENNLRIKFDDTSVAGSYPRNDWQLTANDSANGGQAKFSIDDITGGRTPFTVEAASPSHSLYVDSSGRVGFGTSTPVADLHVKDGDTPTLRLEQDTTSGFAPQTWDLAGNETSFFIRDATNGSTLPFRIRPGAASNTLVIDTDNDVGVGTLTADEALHVKRSSDAKVLVENSTGTAGSRNLLELKNAGQLSFTLSRTDGTAGDWSFTHNGSTFNFSKAGTGVNEFSLADNGNLTIQGSLLANGGANTFPDYVFDDGYELRTLDDLAAFIAENGHLPNVMSRGDVRDAGGVVDMTKLQLQTLEKVEELTLYTLAQEETIRRLEARLAELEGGADE